VCGFQGGHGVDGEAACRGGAGGPRGGRMAQGRWWWPKRGGSGLGGLVGGGRGGGGPRRPGWRRP
jgi:hypothetical protein